MEKCGEGVFDAATDVVALGFELAGGTVERLPQLAVQLFQDDAFRKSIKTALEAEGKRLVTLMNEGKSASNQDGLQVLKTVGKSAGNAAQKWVEGEIEKSSDYKALENGLKTLECRFKESPVGVFVDENKGLLIVLASGLAVGGAVAMYTTRSGDWAASQLTGLASKQLRFKVLGNIELGARSLVFKPSERAVQTTAFATAKWKTVKASLDLNVGFKDDSLARSSAGGEVVIDVAKGVSLSGKAGVGYVQPTGPGQQPFVYNLALGATLSGGDTSSKLKLQVQGFVTQEPTRHTVGGSGDLTYGLTGGSGGTPGLTLKAGVKGGTTRTFAPSGPDQVQSSFEAKVGLELSF